MQTQKPGAIPNLGAIPFIRFGEVKNVRSYRKALRQLASRPGGGNSALALYDDNGNVHLQVFQPQGGTQHIVFDKAIGRVPVPRQKSGAPITPGSAPFGNAIEHKVLDLLSMVTGQRFRGKRANAHGPDILAREMALVRETMETMENELRPVVKKIVADGYGSLSNWKANPATSNGARVARAKALGALAQRATRLIPTLTIEEIDTLIGVFYAIEHALGVTPDLLRQFRGAAWNRLRVLKGS